jgi:ElaB/YqjD/DUF883 family membrane-anchored ribosome-binding protein
MRRFFERVVLWLYIKFHSVMINISIALYNTEEEILKANPDDLDEKDKYVQRKLHHNPLLEKFYAGQRDEKYVQDYYELLKKADKFVRKATPHKVAVAADKYHMNYGQKDQYGRRYEHYGFFDGKHRHKGKTLGEVLELEYEERRTKDDNYELLYIFNNKPIETGLSNIMDVVEKTEKEGVDFEYEVLDVFKKSKQFVFPLKVFREEDVVNKIEQLTEFLHIKKIGMEYRLLEFFIPLKFGTIDIADDSNVFKEVCNMKDVFINNDYGEMIGFNIIGFMKRIKYNDTHEVWKFKGIEMETVNFGR